MKNKIQSSFVEALRNGDQIRKRALSNFKAKITEAEKANKNTELSESEMISLLNKSIIQRKESFKIYSDNNRLDLAQIEKEELDVLEEFMPAKMSEQDIINEVKGLIETIPTNLPEQARIGKVIGLFNKKYPGQSTADEIRNIINNI